MDSKETIIQATMELIAEKGEHLDNITVREICKKSAVGLGLINYHFGNKEKLIELCIERVINGIVDKFHSIQEKTKELTPFNKLDYLGNLTLTFLFEHYTISKISILRDMRDPREDDNTHRTYLAYLPLLSACRPDWDTETLQYKTFLLITIMQQSFLHHKMILNLHGVDLMEEEQRRAFHSKVLHDILEV